MHTFPRGDAPSAHAGQDLGRALRSSLDLPLSALRASLESLARDLGSDPRSAGVDQALNEVSRAGRIVRDLADYATPPAPMPLACSIDEVLSAALRRLPREARPRISCANSVRGRRLFLDGPLLSNAIERLLLNAVEASDSEVLITARREAGRFLLTIVNGAGAAGLDPAWAEEPFHTDKPHRLGLGLTLAARDVALQGGTLTLRRTPRGEVLAVVDLPDTEVPRPSREI